MKDISIQKGSHGPKMVIFLELIIHKIKINIYFENNNTHVE